MKKRRTRCFQKSVLAVLTASALFLIWLSEFGTGIAQTHFNSIADLILTVIVLAVASFLLFNYLPYFRGDRRWYSISGILAVVFFFSTAILWNAPVAPVVV